MFVCIWATGWIGRVQRHVMNKDRNKDVLVSAVMFGGRTGSIDIVHRCLCPTCCFFFKECIGEISQVIVVFNNSIGGGM